MGPDADRRGHRFARRAQPRQPDADDEWVTVRWADPHWAIRVTNAETDDETSTCYATAHGPTCADCRAIANAMLQAGQPEQWT